tara:strand:+ start:1183 stop:1902 length:720 start_codon:yes stop_codon:yes gene_type:complete
MENFDDICNWENFFEQAETFKNNKPFKYAFVEEIFKRDFYEKLFENYPEYDKNDESWSTSTEFSKHQFYRGWGKYDSGYYAGKEPDPKLSQEWNKFYRFLHSDEFLNALKKFSDVPIDKMKTFRFVLYHKGGFQLPHIHNDGPSTLIVFFNFSKGWEKGDPGGTYVASEMDESKIMFEPHNLDNTMVILQDGPYSAHGARYITKDVKRKAIQIYFEGYSEETGWTGKGFETVKPEVEEL